MSQRLKILSCFFCTIKRVFKTSQFRLFLVWPLITCIMSTQSQGIIMGINGQL